MGVVYLGFDPALEREVAIKVMGGATVSDPELKKRFEVEAKASAKLQHPNIVTVYDFGYDEKEAPYMAMELLEGPRPRTDESVGTRSRSKRSSKSSPKTCSEASHTHTRTASSTGTSSRPTSSSADDGEVKIMDFGVARLQQSSHTQTGAVLGTADYMSPEQIKAAPKWTAAPTSSASASSSIVC